MSEDEHNINAVAKLYNMVNAFILQLMHSFHKH